MNELIARLVGALKEQQAEIAESAMMRPRAEPVEHGVQAGRYQGLQQALDTIDALLRDEYEEQKKP